jgi:hypothetical protein
MDLSSLVLVSAMGLINSNANMTNMNLTNDTTTLYAANSLASPSVTDNTHDVRNETNTNVAGHDMLNDIDWSSYVFISALGLLNADGNITSINLMNDTTGVYEANPFARPLATGANHYTNTAIAITLCIFTHDELKDFDRRIGLEGDFGTKDVFAIGLGAFECFTISSWASYQKADIGWEVGLSEAEFLITSRVFHIEF